MDIRHGQQFAATCLDPAFTSAGLTLRAMAIAATVIRDGSTMSAARALIDVTAECGGATACNGEQSLSDRDGLTGSEWCAGRRQLRVSGWRSSDGAREDRPSS